MTQAELIKAIAEDINATPASVKDTLDALARVTSKSLGDGAAVTIPGLIKLEPKIRAARTGRNPRTGEAVAIPAKTVVTSKPVKALADYIA